MKFTTSLTAALLPATAFSRSVTEFPRFDVERDLLKRDDVTTTDQYLYDITLDQFISERDAQNPATLNWNSDGCTDSPDNPLGFNYVSLSTSKTCHQLSH